MKPYKYLNELKHDVRPKLMGFASPGAVRAAALRLLENRPESDFLYRHALKDCPDYRGVNELLSGWTKAGHWGIDRLYMRLKGENAALERALRNAVRNMQMLSMYLWNGKGGYLGKTSELILSRVESSGFLALVTRGESKNKYLADHWGGYAVEALVSLGVEDERIDRFYEFILEHQRADGGWLPEVFLRRGEMHSYSSAVSHPLHTVAFARALAADEKWVASSEFKKAVTFLINNCFTEKIAYRKFSKEGWYALASPFFGHSALEILQLAADAEIDPDDENLKKIIKWLAGEQEKGGLWRATVKRRLYPDEEMFLSLNCATILKEILDDNSRATEDEE